MDETTPQSPLLAALGLDLESSLAGEPQFLTDARLLAALHAELREALGEVEAAGALLQMGFAHGLRDAARVVQRGIMRPDAPRGGPGSPRLAFRLTQRAPGGAEGIRLEGSWPECGEAEAVLAALGRCDAPTCHASAGYTSGWLSALLQADVLVLEQECTGAGGGGCRFEAREAAVWRAECDPRALARLEALPFEGIRRLVAEQVARSEPEPPGDRFEAGSPAVHVWGPVMVMPFAGAEESMQALDLIGNDPGARNVRVVVLDLSDAILDEGFGALALEQILAAIEGCGAEPILAGVSPVSETVVADLEHGHVVTRKDLSSAIAAAFQIAEMQRCQV